MRTAHASLTRAIGRYLTLKQALGRRYDVERRVLEACDTLFASESGSGSGTGSGSLSHTALMIASGVMPDPHTGKQVTTGTPIGLLIDNVDQRSRDYGEIKDRFRPSHADYTYFKKYGVRDYRGGGRQSARETAVRVAAGAIARKILGDKISVRGAVVQLGTQTIDRGKWDWAATGDNPFWCPDRQAAQGWEGYLDEVRKRGSSCGAIIEVVASGVPVGWGDPIYDKLDADLAKALMSINAVKGVEIGDGFATAAMTGEENADEMRMQDGAPTFLSNHAGGILGGISTGQPIVARFAVKPTSSILTPRRTVDRFVSEPDHAIEVAENDLGRLASRFHSRLLARIPVGDRTDGLAILPCEMPTCTGAPL